MAVEASELAQKKAITAKYRIRAGCLDAIETPTSAPSVGTGPY